MFQKLITFLKSIWQRPPAPPPPRPLLTTKAHIVVTPVGIVATKGQQEACYQKNGLRI